MPCRSDYLAATHREIALSRVLCLLEELDGKPIDPSSWEGYHPRLDESRTTKQFNDLVVELCRRLQTVDISKQSLEMQIWWRDHQAADKIRIEEEIKHATQKSERDAVLAKLTPYERKLLGLE